jgi:hypothetical protein
VIACLPLGAGFRTTWVAVATAAGLPSDVAVDCADAVGVTSEGTDAAVDTSVETVVVEFDFELSEQLVRRSSNASSGDRRRIWTAPVPAPLTLRVFVVSAHSFILGSVQARSRCDDAERHKLLPFGAGPISFELETHLSFVLLRRIFDGPNYNRD